MTSANSAFWEAITLVAIVLGVLIASTAHVKGWLPSVKGLQRPTSETEAAKAERRRQRERNPADNQQPILPNPPYITPNNPAPAPRPADPLPSDIRDVPPPAPRGRYGAVPLGTGTGHQGGGGQNDNTPLPQPVPQAEPLQQLQPINPWPEVSRHVHTEVIAPINYQPLDLEVFLNLDETASFENMSPREYSGDLTEERFQTEPSTQVSGGNAPPPQQRGVSFGLPPPVGGGGGRPPPINTGAAQNGGGTSFASAAPDFNRLPVLPGGGPTLQPVVMMADPFDENHAALERKILAAKAKADLHAMLFEGGTKPLAQTALPPLPLGPPLDPLAWSRNPQDIVADAEAELKKAKTAAELAAKAEKERMMAVGRQKLAEAKAKQVAEEVRLLEELNAKLREEEARQKKLLEEAQAKEELEAEAKAKGELVRLAGALKEAEAKKKALEAESKKKALEAIKAKEELDRLAALKLQIEKDEVDRQAALRLQAEKDAEEVRKEMERLEQVRLQEEKEAKALEDSKRLELERLEEVRLQAEKSAEEVGREKEEELERLKREKEDLELEKELELEKAEKLRLQEEEDAKKREEKREDDLKRLEEARLEEEKALLEWEQKGSDERKEEHTIQKALRKQASKRDRLEAREALKLNAKPEQLQLADAGHDSALSADDMNDSEASKSKLGKEEKGEKQKARKEEKELAKGKGRGSKKVESEEKAIPVYEPVESTDDEDSDTVKRLKAGKAQKQLEEGVDSEFESVSKGMVLGDKPGKKRNREASGRRSENVHAQKQIEAARSSDSGEETDQDDSHAESGNEKGRTSKRRPEKGAEKVRTRSGSKARGQKRLASHAHRDSRGVQSSDTGEETGQEDSHAESGNKMGRSSRRRQGKGAENSVLSRSGSRARGQKRLASHAHRDSESGSEGERSSRARGRSGRREEYSDDSRKAGRQQQTSQRRNSPLRLMGAPKYDDLGGIFGRGNKRSNGRNSQDEAGRVPQYQSSDPATRFQQAAPAGTIINNYSGQGPHAWNDFPPQKERSTPTDPLAHLPKPTAPSAPAIVIEPTGPEAGTKDEPSKDLTLSSPKRLKEGSKASIGGKDEVEKDVVGKPKDADQKKDEEDFEKRRKRGLRQTPAEEPPGGAADKVTRDISVPLISPPKPTEESKRDSDKDSKRYRRDIKEKKRRDAENAAKSATAPVGSPVPEPAVKLASPVKKDLDKSERETKGLVHVVSKAQYSQERDNKEIEEQFEAEKQRMDAIRDGSKPPPQETVEVSVVSPRKEQLRLEEKPKADEDMAAFKAKVKGNREQKGDTKVPVVRQETEAAFQEPERVRSANNLFTPHSPTHRAATAAGDNMTDAPKAQGAEDLLPRRHDANNKNHSSHQQTGNDDDRFAYALPSADLDGPRVLDITEEYDEAARQKALIETQSEPKAEQLKREPMLQNENAARPETVYSSPIKDSQAERPERTVRWPPVQVKKYQPGSTGGGVPGTTTAPPKNLDGNSQSQASPITSHPVNDTAAPSYDSRPKSPRETSQDPDRHHQSTGKGGTESGSAEKLDVKKAKDPFSDEFAYSDTDNDVTPSGRRKQQSRRDDTENVKPQTLSKENTTELARLLLAKKAQKDGEQKGFQKEKGEADTALAKKSSDGTRSDASNTWYNEETTYGKPVRKNTAGGKKDKALSDDEAFEDEAIDLDGGSMRGGEPNGAAVTTTKSHQRKVPVVDSDSAIDVESDSDGRASVIHADKADAPLNEAMRVRRTKKVKKTTSKAAKKSEKQARQRSLRKAKKEETAADRESDELGENIALPPDLSPGTTMPQINGPISLARFLLFVITHAPIASLLCVLSTAGILAVGQQITLLFNIPKETANMRRRAEVSADKGKVPFVLARLADIMGGGSTGPTILLILWTFFGLIFIFDMCTVTLFIAKLPKEERRYGALMRRFWGVFTKAGRRIKAKVVWALSAPRQLLHSLAVAGEALMMGARCRGPAEMMRGCSWGMMGRFTGLLTLISFTGVLGYYAILVTAAAGDGTTPTKNGSVNADGTIVTKVSARMSNTTAFLLLNFIMLVGVPTFACSLYWMFNASPRARSTAKAKKSLSTARGRTNRTKRPLWKTIICLPSTIFSNIPDWIFDPIFIVVIMVPYLGVGYGSEWAFRTIGKYRGELSSQQRTIFLHCFLSVMTPLFAVAAVKAEDLWYKIRKAIRC